MILPLKEEVKAARNGKKWADDVVTKTSLRLIYEKKGKLFIRFSAEDQDRFYPILAAAIPQIMFHGTEMVPISLAPDSPKVTANTYWMYQSADNMIAAYKFGKSQRFDFDGDLGVRAWAASDEGRELSRMSSAKSTTAIEIPAMGMTLRPFQVAGVAYMAKAKKTFNADEMGLGKTVQAIAATKYTGGFPCLIICPATLKDVWIREVKKALPSHAIATIVPTNETIDDIGKMLKIRHKKTKKITKRHYDFVIVNYDRVAKWLPQLLAIAWKTIVCDEAHYLTNRDAARTRGIHHLLETVNPEYVYMLTGTPAGSRPREVMSELKVMGRLNDFGGRRGFLKEYCDKSTGRDASKADAAEERNIDFEDADAEARAAFAKLIKLNAALKSMCFVRRTKAQVLPELPPKQRTMIPLALPKEARINYERVENDVIDFLVERALKDSKFLEELSKLEGDERDFLLKARKADAGRKAEMAEAIVKIEMCKQAAAAGKIDGAVQWINDFLRSGKKLIVFTTHKTIQRELLDRFSPKFTVHILGSDSLKERTEAEMMFQTNPKVKLIICGLKAAGVGLTLTAASDVVFLELGWTPKDHDQAEDRVHRIGQKDSCNAWYLLAKDTIEEKIAALIEQKRMIVNAITDGNPLSTAKAGSILGDLVISLIGEKIKLV